MLNVLPCRAILAYLQFDMGNRGKAFCLRPGSLILIVLSYPALCIVLLRDKGLEARILAMSHSAVLLYWIYIWGACIIQMNCAIMPICQSMKSSGT